MFKFKMLTKVLVAVFVLGQLIELNLNICIALSIDLDGPVSTIKLHKSWQPNSDSASTSGVSDGDSGEEDDSNEPILASRMPASTTTIIKTTETLSSGQTLQQEEESKSHGKSISQTLESNGRFNYIGKIYVGAKQQPFMVLFDLKSTAFWLPSSECKSFDCISRQKYDGSNSSTHEDTGLGSLEFTYGKSASAKVTTKTVRDRVTFGGVQIDKLTFGEAIEMKGEPFALLPADGILGLGFKRLATNDDAGSDSSSKSVQRVVETPFEQMYKMGLLKEPIFSLQVKSRVAEYMYSANNGELTLGELAAGYQPEEITYVPVTHVDYWEFRLDSISLRHIYSGIEMERACESACPAILDTSTALISGHHTDVDRLNKALGAYAENDGFYRLTNCELRLLPDVVFTIGGSEFVLTPEDYVILRQVNGNILSCHSAIKVVEANQYPFWILGERFLKQHYVVFDYGQRRLGFAKSKSMKRDMSADIQSRTRRKLHII